MMKQKHESTVIAVCGKGGVGKTSISASMARVLAADPDKKVLAIDADPAVGLAVALGIHPERTVDDIRCDLIERVKKGRGGDRNGIVKQLDYEVFEALQETGNLAFLAIGRPEMEGCYCQVNEFLKEIILSVSSGFDYVVIDGEAGIEQINRRVMEHVSHLAFVSDASAKGMQVARTILDVARAAVDFRRCGLIVNRLRGEEELKKISVPEGLELLGWIPEDDAVRETDIAGGSLLEMPDCAMISRVALCLRELGIAVPQSGKSCESAYKT
jgi:CO dehydrogenase maturation factor